MTNADLTIQADEYETVLQALRAIAKLDEIGLASIERVDPPLSDSVSEFWFGLQDLSQGKGFTPPTEGTIQNAIAEEMIGSFADGRGLWIHPSLFFIDDVTDRVRIQLEIDRSITPSRVLVHRYTY